jgi:hypothetical protein
MRLTFSVLLLLLVAPAAFAQEAAPLAPVQAPPAPSVVSTAPAVVEPTRAEVQVNAEETRVRMHAEERAAPAAAQQNRSYYFILGALVALVAVLVFAL